MREINLLCVLLVVLSITGCSSNQVNTVELDNIGQQALGYTVRSSSIDVKAVSENLVDEERVDMSVGDLSISLLSDRVVEDISEESSNSSFESKSIKSPGGYVEASIETQEFEGPVSTEEFDNLLKLFDGFTDGKSMDSKTTENREYLINTTLRKFTEAAVMTVIVVPKDGGRMYCYYLYNWGDNAFISEDTFSSMMEAINFAGEDILSYSEFRDKTNSVVECRVRE